MDEIKYVIDRNITDRHEAVAVCSAVLDVVEPRVASATVDAYTDYDDTITAEGQLVKDQLLALGKAQGRRDPGFGVKLVLDTPAAWATLRAFAPWSINVDLWDVDENRVGTFHDCSYSTVLELADDEAAALSSRLSGVAPVVASCFVEERRRVERQASRRAVIRSAKAKLRDLLGR